MIPSEQPAMSMINVPASPLGTVNTLSEFFTAISDWYSTHKIKPEDRSLSSIWYRGVDHVLADALQPKVYRSEFTARASRLPWKKRPEKQRLALERRMFNEFRTIGASYLKGCRLSEQYLIAQHFGMPTRLLDWTTNPLAALFFASANRHSVPGEVFVMDAERLHDNKYPKFKRNIRRMRNSLVQASIKEIDWRGTPKKRLILAVRPDNQPGRVGQQSSCFTLHMHQSQDSDNPMLGRITIDSKADILTELGRVNVNEFTIYNDLDNLSTFMKRTWGV